MRNPKNNSNKKLPVRGTAVKKLVYIRRERLSGKPAKKKPLINRFLFRHACAVDIEAKQIYLSIIIKRVRTRAFVNSGIIFNIIFLRMVQRLGITPQKIKKILLIFLFDGTRIADIIYKIEEI